jgi:hypothetical protein
MNATFPTAERVSIDPKLILRVAEPEPKPVDLDGRADLAPAAPPARRCEVVTRLGLTGFIGCRHSIISMLDALAIHGLAMCGNRR